MRVSVYFKLGRSQGELDFVDVDTRKDTQLFIDPRALDWIETSWGDECASLIDDFFETLLREIQAGRHELARQLIAQMGEPNETHLGYSSRESAGRGVGIGNAAKIYKSLAGSKAITSGLVTQLEETALMIKGVDRDLVS